MRNGFLVGLIVGVALCALAMNDMLGDVLGGLVAVLSGFVEFLGAAGAAVLLPIAVGVSLFIGSRWAERARGRKDADDAWKRRNAYRGGSG